MADDGQEIFWGDSVNVLVYLMYTHDKVEEYDLFTCFWAILGAEFVHFIDYISQICPKHYKYQFVFSKYGRRYIVDHRKLMSMFGLDVVPLVFDGILYADRFKDSLNCCYCGDKKTTCFHWKGNHPHQQMILMEITTQRDHWLCLGDLYISLPQQRHTDSAPTFFALFRNRNMWPKYPDRYRLVFGVKDAEQIDSTSLHILDGNYLRQPAPLKSFCLKSMWKHKLNIIAMKEIAPNLMELDVLLSVKTFLTNINLWMIY